MFQSDNSSWEQRWGVGEGGGGERVGVNCEWEERGGRVE